MGIRIADPKPGFCSCCHSATPEGRYIDFDAAHDSGAFTSDLGVYQVGQDDLMLCEACIRDAAEILALKPEREAALKRELRQKNLEMEHWKDVARRGLKEMNGAVEPLLEEKRRKVAA